MKKTIVLFYGGIYSQWHKAPMQIDGVAYNCAEQYMMASKARLFNDMTTCTRIMATSEPWEQKKLGRKVRRFDPVAWKAVAKTVVLTGNRAKFKQHPKLAHQLLLTCDAIIAEASPTDLIWGIGLSSTDPRAYDPAKWLGTNWLGEVLMQVREELR